MANVKWSDNVAFPEAASINGTEELVGLKSSNNMKANISTRLLPYINNNAQLQSPAQVIGLGEGSWVPTFTGLVGITPPISVKSSRYIRQGNSLIIAQNLQFTVTDSVVEFITDLPSFIVNPFTTFFQSILMGQSLKTSTPTAMDGDVLDVTSLPATAQLVVNCNATNGTGLIIIQYSAMVDIL